uniref:Uncharacterized protein n=1 Tax=Arundo donax TaxID=35708 RepID=A0A0A9C051_ARUDO
MSSHRLANSRSLFPCGSPLTSCAYAVVGRIPFLESWCLVKC